MIASALFPLFNFVHNNKWAQVVLLVGVGYLIMRWKEEMDEARGACRVEARAEKAARKQSTKIINDMKETSNERIEDAETARNRVPAGVTSDGMHDDDAAFLFGDGPDGEPSG